MNRNGELMSTLSGMITELRSIYGTLISEVILYGSYARGTQTEESDVDIAIILSGKPAKNVTNAMIDCVAAHELSCGKVLSVIDIDGEKYRQWRDVLPFYRNIRREGIVLWKAAA